MHFRIRSVALSAISFFHYIDISSCFPKAPDRLRGFSLRHREADRGFSFDGLPFQQRRADTEAEPEGDLSSVKTIAAIGDSYSSGIGAGNRIDWSCSRYDLAHPYLVSTDERLAGKPFQFLSCSGATSVDVLRGQIPKLTGKVDALLLSAGGNDIDLKNILNDCVFGWRPATEAKCAQQVKDSQDRIDNKLPMLLDDLLSAAKEKLTPTTGRLYYTGYAEFFNDGTPQCDQINWDYWGGWGWNSQPDLTSVRRKAFNVLTRNVNAATKAAVERAGVNGQVIYVDYNPLFQLWGGRFCEEGVTEPDPDRQDLLFYELKTPSTSYDWKVKRQDATTNATDLSLTGRNDIVPVGSFEGAIAEAIQQAVLENPDLAARIEGGSLQTISIDEPPADGSAPRLLEVLSDSQNWATSQEQRGRRLSALGLVHDLAELKSKVSFLLPDDTKRVFHPRPLGHAIIANLLLWYMEVEEIKTLKLVPPDILPVMGQKVIVESASCPLQQARMPLPLPTVPEGSGCWLRGYKTADVALAYTCGEWGLPAGAVWVEKPAEGDDPGTGWMAPPSDDGVEMAQEPTSAEGSQEGIHFRS